eukprot:TRINITY_DN2953_c0_g1_i1.p1 TRINITY_DN2953_c0_g1~~TRINITY_DN2953_c0_g1_i1.p1  ORF type:complete len:301 (+),score=101.74 TRINITY_DN2953_c0_g1_i1:24-905(+)
MSASEEEQVVLSESEHSEDEEIIESEGEEEKELVVSEEEKKKAATEFKKNAKFIATTDKKKKGDERGVVYLGHIPHGFFEEQVVLSESEHSEDEEIIESEGEEEKELVVSEEEKKKAATEFKKNAKFIATTDKKKKGDERGVVYLGHIPHGFFEEQMKAYFSQFGEITRLRLSRNKKSGSSKHYAFIEFKELEVAQIVAKTMNNYILFESVLKSEVVPKERIHKNLFRGSNRVMKPASFRNINIKQHNAPKTDKQLKRQKERAQAKETKKRNQLKKMGIEYEFEGVSEPPSKK